MLELPQFAVEDRDDIASLVREHPWAMVSGAVDGVPVVSHVPVLLDRVAGAVVRSVGAGLEDDEVHANAEPAATMRRRLLEPNGEPR